MNGKEPEEGKPSHELVAEDEPGRILIVTDEERVRQVLGLMVAEEGQRPVLKDWREPDLMRTIDERFRMVVLDWGSAPMSAARLAAAVRLSQHKTLIAVLVPCWSDLEVGAREVADFLISKPLRVTQIRRVLALACSSRSRAGGRASHVPAGMA